MSLKLFDLAGAEDDRRFSPYCWIARLAIAHKGLPVETVPWRFTEKDAISDSGQGAVPVLRDGDKTIHDSWAIAEYLEEAYPDQPSLFGCEMSKGQARFFQTWVEQTLRSKLVPIIILDLAENLHEKDRAYFIETRTKRFGMSLEEFANSGPEQVQAFQDSLGPVRQVLTQQDYICGANPGYADYILLAIFQWARCSCPVALLTKEDPVFAWRDRMLNLFDGLAGKAKGYPVI